MFSKQRLFNIKAGSGHLLGRGLPFYHDFVVGRCWMAAYFMSKGAKLGPLARPCTGNGPGLAYGPSLLLSSSDG